MHHKLISTGLVLAALLAPALSGCKYDQKNIDQAWTDYEQMMKEGGLQPYKPTGDATIDGAVAPVVDQAHQYQLEYSKWQKTSKAAKVVREFKGNSPEEVAKHYKSMTPEERKAVEQAVAAAQKEGDAQMKTFLKQAGEISKGVVIAVAKVQSASKGDANGIGGLLNTGATLLSGPGKAAIAQADRAGKFCDMTTTMIEFEKKKLDLVAKVVQENSAAQQGGR